MLLELENEGERRREGGTDARPPKGWLELDPGQGEWKDSRHHHDTHTLAVNSHNYRHTEMVTFSSMWKCMGKVVLRTSHHEIQPCNCLNCHKVVFQ